MKKNEIIILVSGICFALAIGTLTFFLQKMPNTTPETSKATPKQEQKKPEEVVVPKGAQTTTPQKGDLVAEIDTTMGVIKLKLFPQEAPKTVENFQKLADKNYYDGIIFHRVIDDFMIQTGDPTGTGRGGESAFGGEFADEFSTNLTNLRGAVSMANAGPNTNGSQFFIVQKQGGTPWLNNKHSVFGQVYEGMDIVDAIATVEVDANDKPLEEIKMNSVKVYTLE